MVQNGPGYPDKDIRDRISIVNDKVTRLEGKHEGHEAICTLRYTELLRSIAEGKVESAKSFQAQNEIIYRITKIGAFLAFILIGIELGKATFPGLFDAIFRVIH